MSRGCRERAAADAHLPVLEQAARWAVRLKEGAGSARDRARFEAWLHSDVAHAHAWEQVQAVERSWQSIPDSARELAARTLEGSERNRRRQTLKLLGFGALAALTGVAAHRWAGLNFDAHYVVAHGMRARHVLPDGTQLHLDAGSAVDVAFDVLERRLVLRRGRMLVETGGDARARPLTRRFWVETPHTRLRALGTRFGVRLEGQTTHLHVTDGQVAVYAGEHARAVISPGWQVAVAADPASALQRSPLGHDDPDAWTRGALVARAMPLRVFLAELARYQPGITLQADARVADLPVSGVFQVDGSAPAERALQALTHTLPIRIQRPRQGYLLVTRRP